MFVSNKPNSAFAIVTDYRFKSDHDLDVEEPKRGVHVLEFYTAGKKALGPHVYQRAHKIALFEHGAKPTARERADARGELRQYLLDKKIKVACILPTPAKDEEGSKQKAETICWDTFRAPDALAEMRGCYFEYNGIYIQPIFSTAQWLKQLQHFQQAHWLQQASAISRNHKRATVIKCPRKDLKCDADTLEILNLMYGKTIAVDIENIESLDCIIAVGLSDGNFSVSLPLHEYTPYNCHYEMPALESYTHGPAILKVLQELLASSRTVKIFHNHTFDIPRLKRAGLHIGGAIHDTFAAHANLYPELRHGLQHACASVLNITPWKSIWHPKLPGITRDDIEYWICDPVALMDYNADDAWHTFKLAEQIFPRMGLDIFK